MSSVSTSAAPTTAPTTTRMRSADRRELILEAATAVFGELGYGGATTDRVAKAAGVSQPYVVRMFGTKEQLFLDVLRRALDRLLTAFRAELAKGPATAEEPLGHRLGQAYVELLRDRGILLSLMQAFVMGSDPVIGKAARAGWLEVYAFLRREAGFGPEEVHEFLANGMLLNTLVGLRMSDDYETSADAAECMTTALPQKLEVLLELGEATRA
jgi:TetR/AcrR family transcriptional regulator